MRISDWSSDVCSSDLGNRLSHIANGQIKTDSKMPLASRLLVLDLALTDLLLEHRPDSAAVEEVFVNNNPQSTLKLGQACGVVLLGASRSGLEVGEYAARLVKKSRSEEHTSELRSLMRNSYAV